MLWLRVARQLSFHCHDSKPERKMSRSDSDFGPTLFSRLENASEQLDFRIWILMNPSNI